jgi:hypothetical protein
VLVWFLELVDQRTYIEKGILDEWSGYSGYIQMEGATKFIEQLMNISN